MAILSDWNGSAEDSDHDLLMDEIDHGSNEPSRPALALLTGKSRHKIWLALTSKQRERNRESS